MKRLIVGAVTSIVLGTMPTAIAEAAPYYPCTPEPVCHEFDWAIPYYDAFENHGIGYIAAREGIPLMDAVDMMCHGKKSEGRNHVTLTGAEYQKVVEAASDVCPEVFLGVPTGAL
jgi:hypothetical protein